MNKQYGKQVEFLTVYIREAHALDGAMPNDRPDSPIVEEPVTAQERKEVATRCAGALDMSPMTMLIDNMKDTTSQAYAAFPDRLYLVGKDGKIAFAGDRGPMGFNPDGLEDAVREALGMEPIKRESTERGFDRSRRGFGGRGGDRGGRGGDGGDRGGREGRGGDGSDRGGRGGDGDGL